MSDKFSSGMINPTQTEIIDRYRSLTDIGRYLKKICVWDAWAMRMVGRDIGIFFYSQLSLSGHLPGVAWRPLVSVRQTVQTRSYIPEILPIRRKTLSNHSISSPKWLSNRSQIQLIHNRKTIWLQTKRRW